MRNISTDKESGLKHVKTAAIAKLAVLTCFSSVLLLTTRCASIQAPTGGPKDSIAPTIVLESPVNLSRNFKANKIVITLDEFIKLNNQAKEISITPEMDRAPIFKVKKKNLEITLPDSLAENTTYSINFGKGLVDYNESNPILNYSYVFATGDKIDSLSISGNVKSALKNEIEKEAKVLLIPIAQDSIFGKKKANIFTLTDTAGNFKLNNLREGSYRIYALKEKNNDRIYNGTDEEIAFIKDSINLKADVSGINLQLFKGVPTRFRTIDRTLEKDGHILLTFNRRIEDPKIKVLQPSNFATNNRIIYSANQDSAHIFIPKITTDSLKFEVSEGLNILDTVLIKASNTDKLERFIKPLTSIKSSKVDKIKHITLTALTPIESIDKGKIKIFEDSISRTNFQLQIDSLDKNKYHIRYNWKDLKAYELVLEEGAIKGYFGEINKEDKSKFTLDKTNNYGDIYLTFTGIDSTQNYVVELIDEKKERVFNTQVLPKDGKISYLKYPGGKYSIRVIFDENNNGRWDTGDVYKKIQPEKIWYLDRVFTIRANWEQQETITLSN